MSKPKIVVWCKELASDPKIKHKTRIPCADFINELPSCACEPMLNYLRDHAKKTIKSRPFQLYS